MLSKIQLKWKIFAFILMLSAIIIMIFCLFQIFLLEPMYKNTKINNINEVFDLVEQDVIEIKIDDFYDNNVRNDLLDTATDAETAIYLFSLESDLVFNFGSGDYYYQFMNKDSFDDIVKKAKLVSPNVKFYITFEDDIPQLNDMDFPAITKEAITSVDTAVVCAKFIKIDNVSMLLVLDARFNPVDPAVETLKQQLVFIAVIVVILSIIVALMVAHIISKPIMKMNETAKLFALGKRDLTFVGKGYSEIVELNNTLNYALEELKKTEELQKELLANVSHDLKTPITLIGGYAQLMKELPEENTPENLQLIIDECSRLNLLINDLLNLSKLQSKTETFNFEKFDLVKLINDVVLRNNLFISQNDVNINFDNRDCIYVYADYQKIEQVIYNFIINAINYRGESKNIDIILEKSDDFVKVIIKDYGIGINEDEVDLIWNRYYRVDKTHQRSSMGTGLGLSIVKEILENHHFEYGVNSKVGEGSSFYFIIPIEK